jgi:glycosyltransferase involved in cell wall biosynthesis
MREAWVMCLPSAYEGFGRPYIEAMAAGTAVVATPNPGAREVLEDGRFGVVADDDRLGEALVNLLSDPAAREARVRAGLAYVSRFDWTLVAAQYEQAYDLALTRRRHA